LTSDKDDRLPVLRFLKGTGTQDHNWLKAVWYDGSCLGESPADIQKYLNGPFNLTLNYPILSRLVWKAFEFAKSF
jgi:hypothetical protein